MTTRFNVKFGEHLSTDQVDSFTSALAQYGPLADHAREWDLVVDVTRSAKLKGLRRQLTTWDQWGFLRWSEN